MFASFRRIFKPTKEEQIQDLELILRLHSEQIGKCSTCENYIPTEMPGFVTDYGRCKARSPVFDHKVATYGDPEPECSLYLESTDYIDDVKERISKLKGEIND